MVSSNPHVEVAIITRTKDRPLLLHRAMDSVLKQTFKNWKHIIINDGGAPSTVDSIVARFQTDYAGRLTVHHQPVSRGMEAASNFGLAQSQSRYVVILDDDDSWHPDFLSRCVAVLRSPPLPNVRGVVCHSTRIDERIESDGRIHEIRREPFNTWLEAIEIPRLCASNTFPPVSFVFERSLIDEVGPFDENLPVLGDWDFNLRAALAGEILVIPECLAFYHHRPDDPTIYGNTITMHLDKHQLYRAYIINKWARAEYKDGRFSVAQAMAQAELNRENYKFSLRANRIFDAFKMKSRS